MDRIAYLADISIRRGCGFAAIAIVSTMVGMSHDALLAIRGAAIMVTLVGVVLLVKGLHAPTRKYQRTELWILLDKRHGLPEPAAQTTIGAVLRERYLWHAEVAAMIALGFWLLAFLVWVTRS